MRWWDIGRLVREWTETKSAKEIIKRTVGNTHVDWGACYAVAVATRRVFGGTPMALGYRGKRDFVRNSTGHFYCLLPDNKTYVDGHGSWTKRQILASIEGLSTMPADLYEHTLYPYHRENEHGLFYDESPFLTDMELSLHQHITEMRELKKRGLR